jgi:hypothetical protein
LQASVVQALPSLQVWGAPVQVPCWQVSLLPAPVQNIPSSQAVPSGRNPFAGQEALEPVQASATSQVPDAERHSVPAGVNAFAGQDVLEPVQNSASSQAPAAGRQTVVLGAGGATHPWTASQVLAVQALPSSGQVSGVPAWHAPVEGLHVSAPLQAFPSPQTTGGPLAHWPPWHVSAVVHPLPSLHVVPSGCAVSTHAAEAPVQVSAASQAPEAARHGVPAAANPSEGHRVPEPVHVSATSQAPAAPRQTKPAGRTWSAGQAAVDPSQVSDTSQAAVGSAGRQANPAGRTWSDGHSLLVSSQSSATSQVNAPLAGRHTSPVRFASPGQKSPTPSQWSSLSHTPADGRQVKVGGCLVSVQMVDSPLQVSATSQAPAASRHGVPAGLGLGGRQMPAAQTLLSQPPVEARHTFPSFAGTYAHTPVWPGIGMGIGWQTSWVQGLSSKQLTFDVQGAPGGTWAAAGAASANDRKSPRARATP